jgi:ATP-dependent RNA helicase RhlE
MGGRRAGAPASFAWWTPAYHQPSHRRQRDLFPARHRLPVLSTRGRTEPLLRALEKERFVEPTPIQASAILHLLAGRDLLGIAQTGTGKTAAFALPMLQHLISTPTRPGHFAARALILAPTRELALQIEDSLRRLASQRPLRIVAILGGASCVIQVQRMRGGADIVVGTPGRICDLMAASELKLHQDSQFVLDEADRMLDLGFIRDIRRIVAALPDERQSALFSATMPPEVATLAGTLLRDPLRVDVARSAPAPLPIEQRVHSSRRKEGRCWVACWPIPPCHASSCSPARSAEPTR